MARLAALTLAVGLSAASSCTIERVVLYETVNYPPCPKPSPIAWLPPRAMGEAIPFSWQMTFGGPSQE